MHSRKIILSVLILGSALFFSSCRQADAEALRKVVKERQMADAKYVGSQTCALCHEKESRAFSSTVHGKGAISIKGVMVEGCEMCHGPGSLHVEAGGGRGKQILNPNDDPAYCYACHVDKKEEFALPHHHPVPEGHMSCTDCHDPHGETVKPWSAASIGDANEKCFSCHKEYRGPFTYEHQALRKGCFGCHKVHGSVNDKMLAEKDSKLCIRCHATAATSSSHSTGAFRLSRGTCFSGECHTEVHGSNFDEHLRY